MSTAAVCLHVGPASAGSHPGPACYAAGARGDVTARRGARYIDPEFFLGAR